MHQRSRIYTFPASASFLTDEQRQAIDQLSPDSSSSDTSLSDARRRYHRNHNHLFPSANVASYNSGSSFGSNGNILNEDTHRAIDALSDDSGMDTGSNIFGSHKKIDAYDVMGYFVEQLPPGMQRNLKHTYRMVRGKMNPLNDEGINKNYKKVTRTSGHVLGAVISFLLHVSFSWQYIIYGMQMAVASSDAMVTWILDDRKDPYTDEKEQIEPSRSTSRVSFATIARSVQSGSNLSFSGDEYTN